MEIINGVEIEGGAYLLGANVQDTVTVYTDDQAVTFAQTGHTLVMNSTSNKAFTLPTPSAAMVGCWFTFVNINTGRLTINVAGTGVQIIDGTTATGTVYSDTDSYAEITLKLVSATKWVLSGGAHGTWTTT